jgi:hypothetical protein
VSGADLLEVGVHQLRLARDVAAGPDVDALRTNVDVEARVVPEHEALEEVRRLHVLGGGQLLQRLALVALAIGVQVVVVDLRDALDEHHRRVLQAAACGIGEQQRHARVGARVERLLGVAEPGRHIDGAGALPVVGRHGPRDGMVGRVDRRVLGGDEAGEDLLDVLGQ